jgi:acetylornithine deacetylase
MLERLGADGLPELRWELQPLEMASAIRRARFGPFEIDRDHQIVRTVATAYREVYGAEPETGAPDVYKFYGTDAAHLWHTGGIPGVVCGPGGKQTTSPNEAMEIDELVRAAQIYALAILDVCSDAQSPS